jgi:hypothetical protein
MHIVMFRMKFFTAKTAKKNANGQPASPMDTWTAERPFAWFKFIFPSAKNLFFADGKEMIFPWTVIRSAVLYSA